MAHPPRLHGSRRGRLCQAADQFDYQLTHLLDTIDLVDTEDLHSLVAEVQEAEEMSAWLMRQKKMLSSDFDLRIQAISNAVSTPLR